MENNSKDRFVDRFSERERELVGWIGQSFAGVVEVHWVGRSKVECLSRVCSEVDGLDADEVALALAENVCRVLNGGRLHGLWYVAEEPVYYRTNGRRFYPESNEDFDRVSRVKYVIEKADR